MTGSKNSAYTDLPHWSKVLKSHWGIAAELTPLDGEYDLNILADTDDQGFVLKVMRPDCPPSLVEFQIEAMEHLCRLDASLPIPAVIRSKNDHAFEIIKDENGAERLLWVLSKLSGRPYAAIGHKSPDLVFAFGEVLGRTDKALENFAHPDLDRDFKWNLPQANWIEEKLDCIENPTRRTLLDEIIATFNNIAPNLSSLPIQAIHNDANDYNILAHGEIESAPTITGLIDFGDMCYGPRICDLAIAAAYLVFGAENPEKTLTALVAGYHKTNPLTAAELDLLWPLLRMRLAVSVVNSTLEAAENPDDPYVTTSQAPAWQFLEGHKINAGLLNARLRAACGLEVAIGADRALEWIKKERGNFHPIIGQDLANTPMGSLSVENSTWPQNPFDLPVKEAAQVGFEFDEDGKFWLGYYNEPRLIYTGLAFRNGPWKASDRRTVHLAVDIFGAAGTPLYAPLDGEVFIAENRQAHLDYGGVIILRHQTPEGDPFYTLYGHLDPEFLDRLKPGDRIKKGQKFCHFGTAAQNGGWSPHVHFQLALSTEGMDADWPGVGDPDEMYLWNAICPNPAPLLNLEDNQTHYLPTSKENVLRDRQAHFGGNLSLTYSEPVLLVRGWKHHLFDEWGRPYLDAYNNVPHVGHAHPCIQEIAADQLRRMNSNTRYLHPSQTSFAKKLLSKCPDEFEVCYFVNSGSEANELALRLARAHTGKKGMITPDHGYHGNTTGAIDMSAYKFNKPGGAGKPQWVELIEVANDYRGSYKRDDTARAQKFANLVDPAIKALVQSDHGFAGFIAETFPSVGGQIIPPPGYLGELYQKVRDAGGVCIADEVQTGLGRLGEHYFAFEQQSAIPDIIVLGKPIGNGHPIGAVITTRAIAESFDNGIEFFSTFGGSTLSCRIGKAVLDIVDNEGLQQNAAIVGDFLIRGLKGLQSRHAVIGDVRGMGLFIGVELIHSDRSEATALCSYVKNRMREHRILIGSEGPKDNILKIRPPLTIDKKDAEMILTTFDKILNEID